MARSFSAWVVPQAAQPQNSIPTHCTFPLAQRGIWSLGYPKFMCIGYPSTSNCTVIKQIVFIKMTWIEFATTTLPHNNTTLGYYQPFLKPPMFNNIRIQLLETLTYPVKRTIQHYRRDMERCCSVADGNNAWLSRTPSESVPARCCSANNTSLGKNFLSTFRGVLQYQISNGFAQFACKRKSLWDMIC